MIGMKIYFFYFFPALAVLYALQILQLNAQRN